MKPQQNLSELQKSNLYKKQLWKVKDIAQHCEVSVTTVYEMMKIKGFPRPNRLPTSTDGTGNKRWKAGAVIAYIEGCM